MNEKKSGLRSIRIWWLGIAGGLLMMALAAGSAIDPDIMLRSRNLGNIFMNCGPTMLICAAIAIPFSRGHLDFSALGVGCFTGTLIGAFSSRIGMPDAGSALLAVGIGACVGLINGLIAMIFRRKNVLFMAAATALIGCFYRYLAMAISAGSPIPMQGFRMPMNGVIMFLLPAILLIGVFALFAFTKGKRDFNGIYEKDEDRSRNTIVSFLCSAILASLASVLMVSRMRASMPTMFNFTPVYVLVLAAAGIAIPNVKKSKVGAFLGYIALIITSLAVSFLQNIFAIAGMNTYAGYVVLSVFAVVFIALNAFFGSRAAKIGYAPAFSEEKFAPAENIVEERRPEPAPVFAPAFTPAPEVRAAPVQNPSSNDQYAALAELATLYKEGVISEELYNKRKKDIISRM